MVKTQSKLTKSITATKRGNRVWHRERCIVEITERICELMAERGMSRSELAKELGTTKGYVTQLLGGANMTIGTISDLFLALGRQVRIGDEEVDASKTIAFSESMVFPAVYALGSNSFLPSSRIEVSIGTR